MTRVYVGNLDPRVSDRDLEDEFRMFGVLRRFENPSISIIHATYFSDERIVNINGFDGSVWVARRPPGYAFVEFDDHRDALDAIQRLDGLSKHYLMIQRLWIVDCVCSFS